MAFTDGLLPASFRGIPFFVHGITTTVGRRIAIHEYPFRDVVWIEDLGRGARSFGFHAFVNGPLASVQRDALLLAMEKEGPGTLSHPTLGIFTCSLVSFASSETDDALGVFTLEMEFMETGSVEFPVSTPATGDAIDLGALNLLSASSADFVSAIGTGAAVLSELQNVVTAWVDLPLALASDAASIAGCVIGLGSVFGRYQGSDVQTAPDGSTPASLLTAAVAAQSTVQTACAAATAASGTLAPAAVAAAVQAVLPAVCLASASPQVQIRVLAAMAAFMPSTPADTSAVGTIITATATVTGALCRQAALAQMALSVQAYAPTSYNAAVALQTRVTALFDAEIVLASDAGDTATSTALRALRSATIAYLSALGANLAPLRLFTPGQSLPAWVVAQLLYQDATRADELTAQVNPVDPSFFPAQFLAEAY